MCIRSIYETIFKFPTWMGEKSSRIPALTQDYMHLCYNLMQPFAIFFQQYYLQGDAFIGLIISDSEYQALMLFLTWRHLDCMCLFYPEKGNEAEYLRL